VSAGPKHPVGPDRPDGIPDPEMSALAGADEPGWYEDDAPGLSVPAQEAPGSADPVWEAPAPGDLAWDAPDPGVPGWEIPDLHDPSDDLPAGAAFAEGGWADGLGPDPVLATVVDLVQREGLGTLDDDQLTGCCRPRAGWWRGRPRRSCPRCPRWPGGGRRRAGTGTDGRTCECNLHPASKS
jgi:hypothetical protein